MTEHTHDDADRAATISRGIDARTFTFFAAGAVVIAVLATLATRFIPAFPEMSDVVAASPSSRADYERLRSLYEWLEAAMTGLLAGASVLLAATIWAKPAPGEADASWRRKLTALTVVSLILAAFPLVYWAIRSTPFAASADVLWWLLIAGGAVLVIAVCVVVPYALLRPTVP